VAAVLRTLIVRGEGDDVIRKLCRRKHVPIPKVLVTRAAHDGPSVVLSAGAIPVTPEDEDNRTRSELAWWTSTCGQI